MTTVTMIDATHTHVGNVPGNAPKVAGYVTGTPDIRWVSTDWARFPRSGHVRIDQSASLSVLAQGVADVGDVESGAGTAATLVTAARARASHGWGTTVYGTRTTIASIAQALNWAGVPLTHISAWVADWSLSETGAQRLTGTLVSGLRVVAVQWASPTSNPSTVVPGGSATLKAAQVDLSVADATWFAPAAAAPPPAPRVHGVVVTSDLRSLPVTSADRKVWTA